MMLRPAKQWVTLSLPFVPGKTGAHGEGGRLRVNPLSLPPRTMELMTTAEEELLDQ